MYDRSSTVSLFRRDVDFSGLVEETAIDELIENTNDAVSYTDGYLVVVCGLTNVTNIASRTALEMSYWSGVEYGFLEIGGYRGISFMMPQKASNPNNMELIRVHAGQMIGHLTGVAVAGLRTPHGDAFEMLHMAGPTLAALETTEKCASKLTKELRELQVHKEKMLTVIRESYISATELASQIVRDYELGYRAAHEIVNEFVLASREQKIPATEARAELLDEAARKVLGRKLGLADARARHLKRIETLEQAQQKMLSDLQELCQPPTNEASK